jgi:hypothetical protein
MDTNKECTNTNTIVVCLHCIGPRSARHVAADKLEVLSHVYRPCVRVVAPCCPSEAHDNWHVDGVLQTPFVRLFVRRISAFDAVGQTGCPDAWVSQTWKSIILPWMPAQRHEIWVRRPELWCTSNRENIHRRKLHNAKQVY